MTEKAVLEKDDSEKDILEKQSPTETEMDRDDETNSFFVLTNISNNTFKTINI